MKLNHSKEIKTIISLNKKLKSKQPAIPIYFISIKLPIMETPKFNLCQAIDGSFPIKPSDKNYNNFEQNLYNKLRIDILDSIQNLETLQNSLDKLSEILKEYYDIHPQGTSYYIIHCDVRNTLKDCLTSFIIGMKDSTLDNWWKDQKKEFEKIIKQIEDQSHAHYFRGVIKE